MRFSSLFKPIKIGSMTVRNRFVVPPMGTNYANDDGTISQRSIDYYAERAKGGFGLITIEVTAVEPKGKAIPNQPGLWSDKHIASFQKLVDEIHKYGAKVSIQLHHAGRQTVSESIGGEQPVAPSSIPCPSCLETPKELTTEEVYEIIGKFVDAAERAWKAGADAVEIHGAHGYLISQFMSPYSNRRLDEFGGSFENRMRFPKLIIEGIRRRLGNDYPIIYRISGEEKTVGGRTIPETRAIAQYLEDLGINAMHVASGSYASMNWIFGGPDFPMGYMAQFAEEVKKSVNIPVITVGKIHDPYIADELVSSGRADMVSIGRQSIADPEFPNKILAGELDKIAPCISCHQGCTGKILFGEPATCVVNPFVGKEAEMKFEKAPSPKNIIVVGGGPAGLVCAWVLAERGHHVTLYEKEGVLGGQYRIGAYPPGKADLVKPIQYFYTMGKEAGVVYELNTEVTAEMIGDLKPDAVILATGGIPAVPKIEGIDNPKFAKANDVLLGKARAGKKVLIAGGGLTGVETADYLGEYGCDITIVEMASEAASDVNPTIKITLMERLKNYGVNILTNTKIKQFVEDGIICEQNGETKTIAGFDTVILALGVDPYNPLEEKIKDKVKDVYVIGDAVKAGKVLEATSQAAELAISI